MTWAHWEVVLMWGKGPLLMHWLESSSADAPSHPDSDRTHFNKPCSPRLKHYFADGHVRFFFFPLSAQQAHTPGSPYRPSSFIMLSCNYWRSLWRSHNFGVSGFQDNKEKHLCDREKESSLQSRQKWEHTSHYFIELLSPWEKQRLKQKVTEFRTLGNIPRHKSFDILGTTIIFVSKKVIKFASFAIGFSKNLVRPMTQLYLKGWTLMQVSATSNTVQIYLEDKGSGRWCPGNGGWAVKGLFDGPAGLRINCSKANLHFENRGKASAV